MSGFSKRSESPYDPFGAAHSSTSISAALGLAIGCDMGLPTGDAIVVNVDRSMTAGMAYWAMNTASHLGKRLFVILTDNDMSTAPPVGALKRCLNDLPAHASFASLRSAAEEFEAALPSPVWDAARRAWALVTGMPGGGTLFEDLGFSYSGPIDGPDMAQVLVTRRAARTRAPC